MLPANPSGTTYSRCSRCRNTRSPPIRTSGSATRQSIVANLPELDGDRRVAIVVALDAPFESEVVERRMLDDEVAGVGPILGGGRRRRAGKDHENGEGPEKRLGHREPPRRRSLEAAAPGAIATLYVECGPADRLCCGEHPPVCLADRRTGDDSPGVPAQRHAPAAANRRGLVGLGEAFFAAGAVEAYLHEHVAPVLLGLGRSNA